MEFDILNIDMTLTNMLLPWGIAELLACAYKKHILLIFQKICKVGSPVWRIWCPARHYSCTDRSCLGEAAPAEAGQTTVRKYADLVLTMCLSYRHAWYWTSYSPEIQTQNNQKLLVDFLWCLVPSANSLKANLDTSWQSWCLLSSQEIVCGQGRFCDTTLCHGVFLKQDKRSSTWSATFSKWMS